MNDMLAEIFERQEQLREMYLQNYDRAAVEANNASEIRLLVLAAIVEYGELLQLTNWKPWKRMAKEVSRVDLLGELADQMHFFVELCQVLGFEAADIYNAYMAKADVNEARQREGY